MHWLAINVFGFWAVTPSTSDLSQFELSGWHWVLLGALASLLVTWSTLSFLIARYAVVRRRTPYSEVLSEQDKKTFTEHRLLTRDGHSIGSWYAKGIPHSPVVVLVHGNQNDRSQCLPYARLFQELGCGTLLITLRAHGDSSGTLNDFGYGGRHDVMAAVEFIKAEAPGRPILLVGISAGAASVSFAAKEIGIQVAGVVLEQPYLNIMTAVKRRTEILLPWGLSHIAFIGLLIMARIVLPHYQEISPVLAVADIPHVVPLWILAGGKDIKAHPEEATAIFQQAGSRAELTIFPEANHESLLDHDPAKYRELARKWIATIRSSSIK